eukprot:5344073-Pyramimonas_sp.AAC.1
MSGRYIGSATMLPVFGGVDFTLLTSSHRPSIGTIIWLVAIPGPGPAAVGTAHPTGSTATAERAYPRTRPWRSKRPPR